MTVIAFPRAPVAPVAPPPQFWPDQTVMHLQSRKLGEVRFAGTDRIVVLLDDGCQIAVPAYELRPYPVTPCVAVILGSRA